MEYAICAHQVLNSVAGNGGEKKGQLRRNFIPEGAQVYYIHQICIKHGKPHSIVVVVDRILRYLSVAMRLIILQKIFWFISYILSHLNRRGYC